MRYIFTLLMLVSWMGVFGQGEVLSYSFQTEIREYKDSTGEYLVKYEIQRGGIVFVPAVLIINEDGSKSGGAPHYDAMVTVYKIKKCKGIKPDYDTTIIGTSFKGQYVEGGCFEDRPEDMVNHAKKLQSEMTKPKKPTR